MTPAELARQHEIAEAEAVAQGLPPRVTDTGAQARILSAMGLTVPVDP